MPKKKHEEEQEETRDHDLDLLEESTKKMYNRTKTTNY